MQMEALGILTTASNVNGVFYAVLDSIAMCKENRKDSRELVDYIQACTERYAFLPDKYQAGNAIPVSGVRLVDAMRQAMLYVTWYNKQNRVYCWMRSGYIKHQFARHISAVGRWESAFRADILVARWITHTVPSSSDESQVFSLSDNDTVAAR
jgi:hypothetical protein